ncbi:MAG TPA: hypothetical protein VI357_11865 [Mycobacteriales bacterium]
MTTSRDHAPSTPDLSTAAGTPSVVPVTHGDRTIGVVLTDGAGSRWQRTPDLDRAFTIATVTGGAVAAVGLIAAAVGRPRVQRITMGPGGWVSFRGAGSPRVRGARRPWWAHLLCAHPLDRPDR